MKTPVIEPYLFVGGRCEEAVEFYESALGAKRVMLMRFEEAPGQPPEGMLAPGWEEKVMHCHFHGRRPPRNQASRAARRR